MGTQFEVPKGQGSVQPPLNEQNTAQEEQIAPSQLPSQPPSQPTRGPHRLRDPRWLIISAIGIVLVLLLTLGTVLLVQQRQPSGPRPTPTAIDTVPTPASSVTPGPQPGPPTVSDPAYWDPIVGTQSGVSKVESVSFASMMGTTAQQALIKVRYTGTDAKLDVYVFNNITSAQPTQIFKLTGLIKGDAKISGYSSVMTGEVDSNSSINRGKTPVVDLYREFEWSEEAGKFVQVAFPGIFPDLTRFQAEEDQRMTVNKGLDLWKNNPSEVALKLGEQFFATWKHPLKTTLISGGSATDVYAMVQLEATPFLGMRTAPDVNVTLSRLEGNTHNMWIVTAVDDGPDAPTSIQARSLVASPVQIAGKGSGFEGLIANAFILDHLYTIVGRAEIRSVPGLEMTVAPYSTFVTYDTSFKAGPQEGVVEVDMSSPVGAPSVLVKVLLDAQPRAVQGPVSCPLVLPDWSKLLGIDSTVSSAILAGCANLKGDASLQALVRVFPYENDQPGIIYVYDQITSTHPVQILKLPVADAAISGISTVMTADKTTKDLYREYQWSPSAGKFIQVAFPGIFPDLTRFQAEKGQRNVNAGQDSWKLNAVQTTRKMFETWFTGLSKDSKITLVSGGGARDQKALVTITLPPFGGGSSARTTQVTLTRLEGQINGAWEVTAVETAWMDISTPKSGATITSPVTVTGSGPSFESQVGVVYIFDHLYQKIQVGDNFAMVLNTSSPRGKFSLDVKYTSSFQGDAQEGFIELVHTSGASFDFGFVIVKVLMKT